MQHAHKVWAIMHLTTGDENEVFESEYFGEYDSRDIPKNRKDGLAKLKDISARLTTGFPYETLNIIVNVYGPIGQDTIRFNHTTGEEFARVGFNAEPKQNVPARPAYDIVRHTLADALKYRK